MSLEHRYDRFTGAYDPDPVEESTAVYDDYGLRWDLDIGANGLTREADDGSDFWYHYAQGNTVFLSWNSLVERGPLTVAPPTKE